MVLLMSEVVNVIVSSTKTPRYDASHAPITIVLSSVKLLRFP